MAASSENQINLKTLQRVDSNIIEIIDTASQVAIYKYETKLEQWEGTDIEGTLFLYRRCVYPEHGLIIVNRLNTNNFVESITQDMQFQLQEPYLLYKNHTGEIIGSWFYEQKDLKRISKKIQKIVLGHGVVPRRRSASESETSPDAKQDILTMLSQAHKSFLRQESLPNTMVDFNNMRNFPEKEPQNKSISSSFGKKSLLRACSIDESPVSPRRRFMSSGSFDQTDFPEDSVWNSPKDVSQNQNGNRKDKSVTKNISHKIKGKSFDTSSENDKCKAVNSLSDGKIHDKTKVNSFSITGGLSANNQNGNHQTQLKIIKANARSKQDKNTSPGKPTLHYNLGKNLNGNFKGYTTTVNEQTSMKNAKAIIQNTGDHYEKDAIYKNIDHGMCAQNHATALNSVKMPIHSFVPTRLSPLFSQGEIDSPISDIDVLNESLELHPSELEIVNKPLAARKSDCGKENQKFTLGLSCDRQIHAIQNALTSHIQDNPKAVLKIHEAYVSSLRSFFIKS